MAVCKKNFAMSMAKVIAERSGFIVPKELTIVSADTKKLQAEFTVTKELSNVNGTLHGGAAATIVDNVSSIGLLCSPQQKGGVSVNLSVNYLKAAKIGETVIVDTINQKVGKTLAYLYIELKNKNTGDLIATATHIKHIG